MSDVLGDQSQKADGGKRRWSLFPFKGAEWIVRVLEFGAKKYRPQGWRTVDNFKERYSDAAMRHLIAYIGGEYYDSESGLPHLAHLGCCVLFLQELDAPEIEKAEKTEFKPVGLTCVMADGYFHKGTT